MYRNKEISFICSSVFKVRLHRSQFLESVLFFLLRHRCVLVATCAMSSALQEKEMRHGLSFSEFPPRCCVKQKSFIVSKKFSLCSSLFHNIYICSHSLYTIGLALQFGMNYYPQGLSLAVLTESYIFTLINSTVSSTYTSSLYQHALLYHSYLMYTLGNKHTQKRHDTDYFPAV